MRIVCLLSALPVLLSAALSAAETTFYVSPRGNDAWSGGLAEPNAAGTDGPLATLAGARDRVRQHKAGGAPTEPIKVLFRSGVYRQSAAVVFEPADSGSPQCPITYAAYPSEQPVFSGGREVTGWRRETGDRFSASVPAAANHRWVFRQLWVNGQRRTLARSPNTGYFHTAGPAAALPGPDGKPVVRDKSAVRFRPGDLRNWPNLADIDLYVYHHWEVGINPLKAVDEARHTATIAGREHWPFGWAGAQQRYLVENAPDALDAPGEWQLDRLSGQLAAIAKPGEDLTRATVVAPVAEQLVVLRGDAAAGRWIDSLRFEGLSFQHTNYVLPPDGHGDPQAAVTINAAIQANGTRNCAIERCEVAHIGNYAIWFEAGCQNNQVLQCELWDLGAGGVRLGTAAMPKPELATGNNRVENCYIHDGGIIHAGAIGVWVGQSSDNVIAHNEIADLNYSAISVGWSWGFHPTACHRNRIEYNRLHHLARGVLSDMGGIYTLGISTGTVIRGNYIHDVWGYHYGGCGIYPDEGSTGILIENNVTWRTSSGGFSIHYGRDLTVRNNIFGMSRDYLVSRGRKDKQSNSLQEGNLYVWDRGALMIGNADLVARRNLYWYRGDEPAPFPGGLKFADWQAKGFDQDSLLADPLLVDPDHDNFQLKPDSPALKLGFQPIDVSQAGLTGPREWRQRPLAHRGAAWPLSEPEPGEPLLLNDGFEDTPVGATAVAATTHGEKGVATIRVTDERAAGGRHSLKFSDQPNLDFVFNPHLWYTPNHVQGTVRFSFDLSAEPGASVYVQWRDAANPYRTGPSVHFLGGQIKTDGKTVCALPAGAWAHVEMTCPLGTAANGKWSLKASVPGQSPVALTDLPCDPRFRKLQWLGIVADANAAVTFYVDNVKLEVVKSSEK